MAEPPYKRARRPDSKQMWDEADRRAPARDERRDDRRDDRNRDRDRRYRSRSPRESRAGGDQGGRARERDYRERDSARGRDERGGRRDGERGGDRGGRRDGGRDRERDGGRDTRDRRHERSRSRERTRDHAKREDRSRSPRRDRDRDSRKEVAAEKDIPKIPQDEEIPAQPAAPVSFKVGGQASAQDHDRMETDEDIIQAPKEKGSKSKKGKAKPVEDDDDIVIEDDGMAAMQAMMGFGGFGTTHQKKVEGNNVSAVRKEKKTEYRQYMNRQGGFNRPLSPTREG